MTIDPRLLRAAVLVALAFGCSGAGAAGDVTDLPDGRSADSDGLFGDGEHDDGAGIVDGALEVPETPPNCGDGVVDPDEECDDGNRLDGDGCDWLCRIGDGEPPGPPDGSIPPVRPEGEPAPVGGTWEPATLPDCYRVPFFWTDGSYAILWATVAGGRFARFDRAGARVGLDVALPSTGAFDAAWNGASFALVWCETDSSWMQLLTKDGDTVGAPVRLAARPGESCSSIAVAWDGGGFDVFAIWRERSLRFVRTGPDAVVLTRDLSVYDDPDPHSSLGCVSAAAAPAAGLAAVGAHDADAGRTEVSAVSPDGTVLRAASVVARFGGGPPEVEWDGSQFGVLTFGSTTLGEALYLARFSPTGDLLAAPTFLVGDRSTRALALAAGLGWAAASLQSSPMGGGFVLERTDREGRVVQQLWLEGPGWDEFLPWAISLAFDGEGFGIVGVGDDPPWFGRFVFEP